MASAPAKTSAPLRLLAQDADDLNVLSAALQDAVCTIGDIQYERTGRRLTVAVNRFRWEAGTRRGGERVRAALQISDVLEVKAKQLRMQARQAVLEVLTIGFEPGEAPGGAISLTFAGGGVLRCVVECIDAVLADVSAPWPTPNRPRHDLEGR